MGSRRVYITLNDEKEKDRVIIDYLSLSYSEADAIKEAIYRLATNNIQSMQMDTISTEKVQSTTKSNNEVKNNTNNTKKVKRTPKGSKKAINETDNTNLIQSASKNRDKVVKDDISTNEVGKDDILLNLHDIEAGSVAKVKTDSTIRQNELEQLKEFI